MQDFRKPENKNIYLTDIIFYCLKKWRVIIAFMVILAVCLGGYKVAGNLSDNASAKAQAVQSGEEASGDDQEEGTGTTITNLKVTYYNALIADKEAYVETLMEYIDGSVIMNLDPFALDTAKVTYYIDAGDEAAREVYMAAYEDLVMGGSLAKALIEADGQLTEAELSYLISFESDTLSADLGTYEDTETEGTYSLDVGGDHIFRIRVYAPDADTAATYAAAVIDAVEAYADEIAHLAGDHELVLIGSEQTVMIDEDILTYQNNILTTYTTALTSIDTLTDNLETVIDEEGETITVSSGTVSAVSPFKGAAKYIILGLIAGFAAAVVILVLIFLLSGRLMSVRDFKEEYGIRQLGRLTKLEKKKRLFGFVDRWVARLQEGAYSSMTADEQIKIAAANIKAAAQNEEVFSIMLAGSLSEQEAEKACEGLTKELEGLAVSEYGQIVFRSDALSALSGYDGVVFIEKKYTSFTKLIDEERALSAQRNVKILGAVII